MNAVKMLAARACQISATGQFGLKSAEPVPSPCVSVCRMAPDRSHCEGCFRTLDDIRAWSQAGNGERRAIWAAALRRAGLALPEELE
ncbi:DUF1289 domain-containing protein [Alicycliphilus denitrificans]|uniref:DUF1289 domain-containing protein n=1 Tax=Alicycliphilus denitrificans TaxID=179636 RepID=A0A420K734_9BURK|nr:DUF1289 domain-containing protein [Alicycliphilus denitrificans]MBN9575016.1 DUF1289 domain-containing protein [Alicycliphilus denitrificans]OJW84135.1 MAG: DUF1289 domain-containing protein [Alicycliphilus sp. 69-12]RKJ93987.1 DUF1289 domain-containing protein [Alicycliphilus denitrificans]